MKCVEVYQVDAFTRQSFGGNPAGVVTEANGLSEEEMQNIAREMNCSETAFVLPATDSKADFKVRFFTPSEEVDLCGHATIATFHVLFEEGKIKLDSKEKLVFQETKAGILPVYLIASKDGKLDRVVMGQTLPEIIRTSDEVSEIADLLGLKASDLKLNNLPLQVVSTGLPDMMVPIKDLNTLKKASPDFGRLVRYQKEKGFVSIHAFTFETENPNNDIHTRDFAPSVEINEEAATGTANGALAAYLIENKAVSLKEEKIIMRIEQGHIMDRPSEIIAEILNDNGKVKDVKVGGSAVIVMKGKVMW
ncbi:MAG: PhzF family phenazine biosynthesis protein [Clostridiaceae bacterium]|nr:PhzF family phenazine biosynthesis protein [Clostridiaceae bacterium]MBW4861136.1 PhzF family phenazine biosynthesis protein [Clostridiaceae bacterium]MBW4869880.1 PhzF family phenazine biosynthesis protein [Clostridiaceae bacterium]